MDEKSTSSTASSPTTPEQILLQQAAFLESIAKIFDQHSKVVREAVRAMQTIKQPSPTTTPQAPQKDGLEVAKEVEEKLKEIGKTPAEYAGLSLTPDGQIPLSPPQPLTTPAQVAGLASTAEFVTYPPISQTNNFSAVSETDMSLPLPPQGPPPGPAPAPPPAPLAPPAPMAPVTPLPLAV